MRQNGLLARFCDSAKLRRMKKSAPDSVANWEELLEAKRAVLAEIASGDSSLSKAEIQDILAEAEQLQSLIALYRTSLKAA
jgi:hypothetical protein